LVQDYKKAKEGDKGPNTGGMGSVVLSCQYFPFLSHNEVKNVQRINEFVAATLHREFDEPYRGILFGGFMKTKEGKIKILEYNCRFGDPEGINIIENLSDDLFEVFERMVNQELDRLVFNQQHCVVQYICPRGYPDNPVRGMELDMRNLYNSDIVYFGGLHQEVNGGDVIMTGSRALAIVGTGQHLRQTLLDMEEVRARLDGPIYYRSDIGMKYVHPNWYDDNILLEETVNYERVGINTWEAERSMRRIAPLVKATHDQRVVSQQGAFTGLFSPQPNSPKVMVSTMDGVGTKIGLVLRSIGKEDGLKNLGQDLVNANLNDLITAGIGVEPLFFLDYYGCGNLEANELRHFIEGVSEACQEASCALIGGETAELYHLGTRREFVGTMIGHVDRENILIISRL